MTELHPLVERLLAAAPKIHTGGTITWALSNEILSFLAGIVNDQATTLETGCGMSTLIFAAQGCRHICITPVAEELDELRKFAAAQGISLDKVTFVCEGSETALPRMDLPELDLVLIDGGHGFPVPFTDWLYTAPRLKVGGLCIVDDVQIWTGEVLADFLSAESGWQKEATVGHTTFFTKTAEHVLRDFGGQPFIQARNHIPGDWHYMLAPVVGHLQAAHGLLQQAFATGNHDLGNDIARQQLSQRMDNLLQDMQQLGVPVAGLKKSA